MPGTLSKVLFTDHYTAASRHLILLSRVTYWAPMEMLLDKQILNPSFRVYFILSFGTISSLSDLKWFCRFFPLLGGSIYWDVQWTSINMDWNLVLNFFLQVRENSLSSVQFKCLQSPQLGRPVVVEQASRITVSKSLWKISNSLPIPCYVKLWQPRERFQPFILARRSSSSSSSSSRGRWGH